MGRPDVSTLRTARLTLRPLAPGDAAAIVEGCGCWEIARWLAVVPFPYGMRDAVAFLAEAGARGERHWAIDDGGGLCGIVSLDTTLGYWLARRVWGRGYMTEAGFAVVDAWFADQTAGPLEARYILGNDASGRVLEKLGFEDAGPVSIHSVALGRHVPGRRVVLDRGKRHPRRTVLTPPPR